VNVVTVINVLISLLVCYWKYRKQKYSKNYKRRD